MATVGSVIAITCTSTGRLTATMGRAIGAREWDSADAKKLIRALRAR